MFCKIKRVLMLIPMLFSLGFLQAQLREPIPEANELANTITPEELKVHLSRLASDEMEGRETGTPGQKKAAEYLASVFREWELPAIGEDNGYFQEIHFNNASWEKVALAINGKEVPHLKDFFALPSNNPEVAEHSFEEVTFLGYGIDDPAYSDYEDMDVKGKAILIYSGEPFSRKGISYLTGTSEPSSWSTDLSRKLSLAKEKGVAAVFILASDFKKDLQRTRRSMLNRGLQLGEGRVGDSYPANAVLSSTVVRNMLDKKLKKVVKLRRKMEKRGKARSLVFPAEVEMELSKKLYELSGENVMGYIEGSDPELKEEIVVLSAHYDHLGKRGNAIYYGADDNASGTSTVLELTEAFVQAKEKGLGPRRSILVLLVSGEEKGLLGSQYFAENPVFPLEQMVVDINVDMIGRVDKKHAADSNYIYVIGSDRLSTELHQINEEANATYTQLELDYTYNAEDDPNRFYYRSDHYNFAKNGIPSIFYFSGTHDDYHRTTDTADKIMYEKMARVGRLIFHTAWIIANRDTRLKVDKKN